MSKKHKLLLRIRQNPKQVRFDELDNILYQLGFAKRQHGSHATYTKGGLRITIPYRQPFILPIYVKEFLALLDTLEDEIDTEGQDERNN
ncbi:MAG: toxin HicA [Anaerolinea sp.]|nr:toxin HicA [Anaerolinea sp.]